MLTKVKITEKQKEVIKDLYFDKQIRFIAFYNGVVKCYTESSRCLLEVYSGALYEVASQLAVGEAVMLSELLKAPSSE